MSLEAHLAAFRASKPAAARKTKSDVETLPLRIEFARNHLPRRGYAKGQLEKVGVFHRREELSESGHGSKAFIHLKQRGTNKFSGGLRAVPCMVLAKMQIFLPEIRAPLAESVIDALHALHIDGPNNQTPISGVFHAPFRHSGSLFSCPFPGARRRLRQERS
jgi:hypothetical protein